MRFTQRRDLGNKAYNRASCQRYCQAALLDTSQTETDSGGLVSGC